MSSKDMLQKALDLYKKRHPKNESFVYVYCWILLHNVPKWMELSDEIRKAQLVQRKLAKKVVDVGDCDGIDSKVVEVTTANSGISLPQKIRNNVKKKYRVGFIFWT